MVTRLGSSYAFTRMFWVFVRALLMYSVWFLGCCYAVARVVRVVVNTITVVIIRMSYC